MDCSKNKTDESTAGARSVRHSKSNSSSNVSHKSESADTGKLRRQPLATRNGKTKKNKFFIVEQVLGHRFLNGSLYYKIHWAGYSSRYDTWEPEESLLADGIKPFIETYISEQSEPTASVLRQSHDFKKKNNSMKRGYTSLRNSSASTVGGGTSSSSSKSYGRFEYLPTDELVAFKTQFYQDIEDGKINILLSDDMYSRVKFKRRCCSSSNVGGSQLDTTQSNEELENYSVPGNSPSLSGFLMCQEESMTSSARSLIAADPPSSPDKATPPTPPPPPPPPAPVVKEGDIVALEMKEAVSIVEEEETAAADRDETIPPLTPIREPPEAAPATTTTAAASSPAAVITPPATKLREEIMTRSRKRLSENLPEALPLPPKLETTRVTPSKQVMRPQSRVQVKKFITDSSASQPPCFTNSSSAAAFCSSSSSSSSSTSCLPHQAQLELMKFATQFPEDSHCGGSGGVGGGGGGCGGGGGSSGHVKTSTSSESVNTTLCALSPGTQHIISPTDSLDDDDSEDDNSKAKVEQRRQNRVTISQWVTDLLHHVNFDRDGGVLWLQATTTHGSVLAQPSGPVLMALLHGTSLSHNLCIVLKPLLHIWTKRLCALQTLGVILNSAPLSSGQLMLQNALCSQLDSKGVLLLVMMGCRMDRRNVQHPFLPNTLGAFLLFWFSRGGRHLSDRQLLQRIQLMLALGESPLCCQGVRACQWLRAPWNLPSVCFHALHTAEEELHAQVRSSLLRLAALYGCCDIQPISPEHDLTVSNAQTIYWRFPCLHKYSSTVKGGSAGAGGSAPACGRSQAGKKQPTTGSTENGQKLGKKASTTTATTTTSTSRRPNNYFSSKPFLLGLKLSSKCRLFNILHLDTCRRSPTAATVSGSAAASSSSCHLIDTTPPPTLNGTNMELMHCSTTTATAAGLGASAASSWVRMWRCSPHSVLHRANEVILHSTHISTTKDVIQEDVIYYAWIRFLNMTSISCV